jgi:ferrous iron transport protein A
MMPIIYAQPDEELELVKINAGKGLTKMLYEMGIYPGVHLRVITNPGEGPIIVEVNGARFGLGRGVAMKLFAVEVSGNRRKI